VTYEADDTYPVHLHNAGAEGEVVASHTMKAKRGSTGPHIFNPASRPGLFNPRERPPIPNAQEVGSVPDAIWKFWRREKAPASAGNQTPVRPEGLGKLGEQVWKAGEQTWKAILDRLRRPCYLSRVGHVRKIRDKKQRTDIGKHSFVNKTIKNWKQLPAGTLRPFTL